MAAIWRGAWRSKKVSSARRGYGDWQPMPIFGSSTTNTTSSGTRTTMSSSEPLAVREEEGESGQSAMEEVMKTRRHMKVLVEEFRAGSDADGNNASAAPDRWLSELRVSWLLHLAELDASEQRTAFILLQLQSPAQTWIRALQVISTSVRKCLKIGVYYSDDDDEASVGPPATELLQFVKATLLKMLTFVDAIVAALDPLNVIVNGATSGQQHAPSTTSSMVRAADNVRALLVLDVRHALSEASEQIMVAFYSSPSTNLVADDMIGGFLSAKLANLDQAIRDTFHHIRTAAAPSLDDEEELARVSKSFPDQSLRFIFLINDSYHIRQLLDTSWLPQLQDLTYVTFFYSITNRIDRYIQSYLQVTWAPVLECLNNPKFNCFTRSSPLQKFESMFQTTYATQKLWKVPDPELRKRLRQAITGKVVSGFTKYLQDNNRVTPGITPQEVEEMLQELFEG